MKTNGTTVVFSASPRPPARASARTLFSLAALALALCAPGRAVAQNATGQGGQDAPVEVQLRSYAPPASGRLTVEPSRGGGRVRLTVLGLPEPQAVSPSAQTYVVWAVSGGRVVRVGELRRDRGGNGGLAFDRPPDFESYGVVVTAERSAGADKPGSPALATRADSARAFYPSAAPAPRAASAPPARPARPARPRLVGGGGFYEEVDRALDSRGGGRLITLDGGAAAPQASARARATTDAGRAYLRADFTGVPAPAAGGASVYVLWAVLPDGRIIYMGSLPATETLNAAEIYVRTAGFAVDDYTLAVTAERQRPVPAPSGEPVLK